MGTKMSAVQNEELKIQNITNISQYKSMAKGLMDVAHLTATANQLRQVLELCSYFPATLFIFSILLQVLGCIILLVERFYSQLQDYERSNKLNMAINVLVLLMVVCNMVAVVFSDSVNDCNA